MWRLNETRQAKTLAQHLVQGVSIDANYKITLVLGKWSGTVDASGLISFIQPGNLRIPCHVAQSVPWGARVCGPRVLGV